MVTRNKHLKSMIIKLILGQARVKKVQILDQEFCDSNLKSTREGKTPFTVMPKVNKSIF